MKREIQYSGYKAGALAAVVRMHMSYYGPNWGFGISFETKVASELSEFLGRFDSEKDLFLTAYDENDQCVGSISLDARNVAEKGAHVRWFIVDQDFAGDGIGRQLLSQVIRHCDESSFRRSYLTTFDGLHAARSLYESFDYELVNESDVDQWAGGVREQLFERSQGKPTN